MRAERVTSVLFARVCVHHMQNPRGQRNPPIWQDGPGKTSCTVVWSDCSRLWPSGRPVLFGKTPHQETRWRSRATATADLHPPRQGWGQDYQG